MTDTRPASPSSRPARGVSLVKRTDRAQQRPGMTSRLSNTYLQDSAKLAGLLKMSQIALVAGLLILAALLTNFSSTHYRIFGTTTDGKLTALPPLDRDLGENTVELWLMNAIQQIQTMGFHDYQLRLQEIRPYFTDAGWESFNRYQRMPYGSIPSLRNMLENDYLVMWPRINKPPQVQRKEVIGGIFTYDMRVEMTLNLNSSASVANQLVDRVDITVERVPPEINPAGIAISRWRANRNRY